MEQGPGQVGQVVQGQVTVDVGVEVEGWVGLVVSEELLSERRWGGGGLEAAGVQGGGGGGGAQRGRARLLAADVALAGMLDRLYLRPRQRPHHAHSLANEIR